MVVPHELIAVVFDILFEESEATTEASEHTAHVSTRLHGDDTDVIFLVDPNQEVLVFVVPDPTGVRPVTRHACGSQQRRDGFVEEEMVIN